MRTISRPTRRATRENASDAGSSRAEYPWRFVAGGKPTRPQHRARSRYVPQCSRVDAATEVSAVAFRRLAHLYRRSDISRGAAKGLQQELDHRLSRVRASR